MLARIIHALRSRIALKLTLTLVGFVALTMMLVGVYLSRGLERVAIESIEARLGTAARVLEDEARAALRAGRDAFTSAPAAKFSNSSTDGLWALCASALLNCPSRAASQRSESSAAIAEVSGRGRLPIVTGGTEPEPLGVPCGVQAGLTLTAL